MNHRIVRATGSAVATAAAAVALLLATGAAAAPARADGSSPGGSPTLSGPVQSDGNFGWQLVPTPDPQP
jgi:hypothetical protein